MKQKQLFPIICVLGFIVSAISCAVLIFFKQLPWLPYIVMVVTTFSAFLLFSFAAKIINGSESYVLYRQLLFSIACVSIALLLMKVSILSYLDIYAIGFGTFHVFGRLGCYKAGCCHGRPFSFGVRYSDKYRKEGFPDYLIGIPVFPVQLMEALGVVLITAFCLVLYFTQTVAPGVILSWYLLLYSTLRFFLEFTRGDIDRPYWSVFSEAQWISFFLLSFIVFAAIFKLIDISMLQLIVASSIIVSIIIVFFIKKLQPQWQISNAHHLKEIAEILNKAFSETNNPPIAHITSLGVCISVSVLKKNKVIFSLSYDGKGDSYLVIQKMFLEIARIKFRGRHFTEKKGTNGVYHFLIQEG